MAPQEVPTPPPHTPFFIVMMNSLLAFALGAMPTNSLYGHCMGQRRLSQVTLLLS